MDLASTALAAFVASDIQVKLDRMLSIERALGDGTAYLDHTLRIDPPPIPGRPNLPRLVHATRVPRRRTGSVPGRTALLHAIAHIEFNAIHLALDASLRFPEMPDAFHFDWIHVATEEARHFTLLATLLEQRGFGYGSFDAHDGLWEMATKTAADVLARMAIVPRIIEARGLDVTPGMRQRFVEADDTEAASILDIILADEVGHVAIGNRWFAWLCAERGLEPVATAASLARRYDAPRLNPPFNLEARRASGFSAAEIEALTRVIDSRPAP